MGRRPILSDYPHLHHVLKKDPVANQQFQAAVSGLAVQESGAEDRLRTELDNANKRLQSLSDQQLESAKFLKKQRAFIKLLGEIIENQTDLEPYSVDIERCRKYTINFSPDAIRVALRLHWDVLAQDMEASIARVVKVKAGNDPDDQEDT